MSPYNASTKRCAGSGEGDGRMTSSGSYPAANRWLSASEMAEESGLRIDLVERFLPAEEPAPRPRYGGELVGVAQFVKELADIGTPAAAIDVAVTEIRSRRDAAFGVVVGHERRRAASGAGRAKAKRAVGAAAAIGLIAGGLAGGLIGHFAAGPPAEAAAPAPATVTETAPAPPAVAAEPVVPLRKDPVCEEWNQLTDSYAGKQKDWARMDPQVSSVQWPAEQRALALAVIPVLKAQAADARRLAGLTRDEFLAGLLRAQSAYELEYANRLPTYRVSDNAYWKAVKALEEVIRQSCSAAN